MRIIDEAVMDRFRTAGKCEWCGRVRQRLEPHHLWQRGIGGGARLDIPINLISLCLFCHTDVHAGKITRSCLLAIVSRREGVLQDEIEREIHRLRKAVKGKAPLPSQWEGQARLLDGPPLAPNKQDVVHGDRHEGDRQDNKRNRPSLPTSEDWAEF